MSYKQMKIAIFHFQSSVHQKRLKISESGLHAPILTFHVVSYWVDEIFIQNDEKSANFHHHVHVSKFQLHDRIPHKKLR